MKTPKHVLLAVTGMTPQVVTESIYALYHTQGIKIDEVKIITTARGKNQAWLGLGIGEQGQTGQLHQLCHDYELAPIQFSESDIHVIKDINGDEIDDARSESDHQAIADVITDVVRALTSDENLVLHASLAGGRKTMTFFLGYAMSLFGRAADTLSHVLVSREFESLAQFFYPTPYDKTVRNQYGEAFNAKSARVTLAFIPFVRMRQEVPAMLLEQGASYSQTIELMNLNVDDAIVTIDMKDKRLWVNQIELSIRLAELAFYTWLAQRCVASQGGVTIPVDGEFKHDYASAYLDIYEQMDGNAKVAEAMTDYEGKIRGMDKAYFNDRKTRLKKVFETALGKYQASAFLPQATGRNDHGQYLFKLNLRPDQIVIHAV